MINNCKKNIDTTLYFIHIFLIENADLAETVLQRVAKLPMMNTAQTFNSIINLKDFMD